MCVLNGELNAVQEYVDEIEAMVDLGSYSVNATM